MVLFSVKELVGRYKRFEIQMNEISSELIGVYDNSTVLVDYLMCLQIPFINNYYSSTLKKPQGYGGVGKYLLSRPQVK